MKQGQPNNFDMGEMDMVFDDKNLTIIYPNGTQDVYDVATTGGASLILQKGETVIKAVNNELAMLKHT